MAAAVSIHIADVGPARAMRLLAAPRPLAGTAGLRGHHVLVAAPLSAKTLPPPSIGRVALLAFWEDNEAATTFHREHDLARTLADGWHALLSPLRMFGSWPGVPDDLPASRSISSDGPAVVVTLGRLRLRRAREFLKTSAKAEAAALASPGFVWGTGLARPPVVATVSLWESTTALSTYAFERNQPHDAAVVRDRAEPFHKASAFVRFRPFEVAGSLTGPNPLPVDAITAAGPQSPRT